MTATQRWRDREMWGLEQDKAWDISLVILCRI